MTTFIALIARSNNNSATTYIAYVIKILFKCCLSVVSAKPGAKSKQDNKRHIISLSHLLNKSYAKHNIALAVCSNAFWQIIILPSFIACFIL